MARALEIKPKAYDETKLAAMLPPFNVRVEKIKGNTRMPIPLPETEDGAPPGTGWDLDTIRGLEQWLVTEWAGGGLYEISVTDSSQQPQTLKWQPFWDPKQFPERTPPPLVDAASVTAPPPPMPQQPQMTTIPQSQPPQQGRYIMPPIFPNGLPQGHQSNGYVQTQPYFQAPPMGNPPMPGTYQWDAYQREVERREREQRDRDRDAELKRLHDEKEKTQRDAIAAQHAAALERERQANDAKLNAQAQQLNELRTMMAGLAASIKEGASQPRTSPELDAIKEQNRQMEVRLERERQEREAERRETATREAMRTMAEQQRQAIEMLQRQMDERARAAEAAALANANKGPDPMMVMWQNSMREQQELAKELSRNQVAQMQSLQAYMMNPRDIMTMAKESSLSVDHATERVTNFFGRVIDTQQKVTENLLSMQPGSNGIVELVGNGMDRVGSLAERYLGGKQLEAQLTAQSQVQVAEAQARAYAQTVIAAQQAEHAKTALSASSASAPTSPQTGLGNPVEPPKKAKPKTKVTTAPGETKRLGKTDAEWFSAIMPQVQELRVNASKFIESIKNSDFDKNGKPLGWSPEQAAAIIVQAIGVVVQRQVEIPILMELLFQDRYADFVDVLVPDPIVTQPYRDELVQNIIRAARIANGLPPEGDTPDNSLGETFDGDVDGDDEDTDDNDDDGVEIVNGASNGQITPLLAATPARSTAASRQA